MLMGGEKREGEREREKEEYVDDGRRKERRRGGEGGWIVRWCGGMAVVGLAAAVALGGTGAALLYAIRPRDPIFEVLSINLKGFNVRFVNELALMFAVLDCEMVLSIKITNPNVAPIDYTSTVMEIFYKEDSIGQASVPEGNQEAKSTQILEIPAKLDGIKIKGHIMDLIKDVTRREMNMHSVVTIKGHAKVWKFKHNFEVHVESDIKVDPIQLEIIEQENKVHLELQPLVS